MNNDRNAAVGDMIIHTPRTRGQKHFGVVNDDYGKWIGIVHEVTRDKWGHKTAFITWTQKHPYYQEEHGESCVNIHNLHREYEVIKRK
jgi:hypothetical protein